jgi:predicted metalloenzyme YecM
MTLIEIGIAHPAIDTDEISEIAVVNVIVTTMEIIMIVVMEKEMTTVNIPMTIVNITKILAETTINGKIVFLIRIRTRTSVVMINFFKRTLTLNRADMDNQVNILQALPVPHQVTSI